MPENNGGVNCEKCGGRKSGGCPLSSNGRKLPLKRMKRNQNELMNSKNFSIAQTLQHPTFSIIKLANDFRNRRRA